MKKRFFRAALRHTGLALAVLICLGATARAQSDPTWTFSGPSGNVPAVNISYTGSGGTVANVTAGPFNVTQSSPSASFQAFCVDLWHGNNYNMGWSWSSFSYTEFQYNGISLDE